MCSLAIGVDIGEHVQCMHDDKVCTCISVPLVCMEVAICLKVYGSALCMRLLTLPTDDWTKLWYLSGPYIIARGVSGARSNYPLNSAATYAH